MLPEPPTSVSSFFLKIVFASVLYVNVVAIQVCEINSSGSVVRSFGGRRSDVTSGRLRVPRSLVLDADGRVLVADSGNWRAVLLDSELRLVRILLNWDVELNRLCFNAATGLLIVGFRSSTVRVYKIKN